MERDNEDRSAVIELGAATVETKGKFGAVPDLELGIDGTGLTDD